jgi:three-Cys-motif partner protein
MKENWGGTWTEEKLNIFQKYVVAYLTIMHNQRPKFKGWPKRIIYFDGFAGSGSQNIDSYFDENKERMSLMDLCITEEETQVYKGSAERVLGLDKQFDEYYFVDIDNKSLLSLQEVLRKYDNFNQCKFIEQDTNQALKKFSENLSKKEVALILLDPFGMQVEWESIKQFAGKRVDIWILVPTGVIVNRLLDKKGELNNISKLKRFFGLSETDIKEEFYTKRNEITLFGEAERIDKIPNAIPKIASLYIKQLKTIWKYVSETPFVLKNKKNVPIYHFVFASNNENAKRIANQIIQK